jgi:hypothetical protein
MWDDDIQPSPGCIAAHVQAMQQHPEVRRLAVLQGPQHVHPASPACIRLNSTKHIFCDVICR